MPRRKLFPPNRNIARLIRLAVILLLTSITLYGANCQRVDYNAVRVSQVIDGDTIVLVNNRHVRYIGLDTPELRKNVGGRWVYEPMPFAEEAKAFNQRLVEGKVVRLEFDQERYDKYNRLLAYCFVGDNLVNGKLLEEGLGLLYTRVPNIKYVDLLVKSQKQARDNKKGIWREMKVVPVENAALFLGRTETVEGRVRNVSITEKAIYLNFGQNYKNDFTAVIFKDDLGLFNKEELIANNFYKGRWVRVTGLIKEYNGPEIIVRHPTQIENLD